MPGMQLVVKQRDPRHDQDLARRFLGTQSAIGRIIRFGSPADPRDFTIVGVVRDAKSATLRDEVQPIVLTTNARCVP